MLFTFIILSLAISVATSENLTRDDEDDPNHDLDIDCGDGIMIPIWRPNIGLTTGERVGRGILYILILIYLFVGISQVSDRFMESIELITSQEKEVSIRDIDSGEMRCQMLTAMFQKARQFFQ